MQLNLLIISKLCFCILKEHKVKLKSGNAIADIAELHGIIYDLYPAMDEASYKLYWRLSPAHYLTLKDYVSFAMAVNLMAQPDVLLLLNDCDMERTTVTNTKRLLDYLEWQEERDWKEMKRSKYDFPIREPEPQFEFEDKEDAGVEIGLNEKVKEVAGEAGGNITEACQELNLRKQDFEILTYALRRRQPPCFTADLVFRTQVINCMKKGWPKLLNKLTPPTDIVIERKKLPARANLKTAKKKPRSKSKEKKSSKRK